MTTTSQPLAESVHLNDIAHLYPRIMRGLQIDFVPNFFRFQVDSPHIAEATWGAVERILLSGLVPRAIKEMIFVAISHENDCSYCESAHLAFCKNLGVDRATRETLLGNLAQIKPERTRFIIEFAVDAAKRPNIITAADRLKAKNFCIPDNELLEVVSMAAFASYANVIADTLAIPIDEEFLSILNG